MREIKFRVWCKNKKEFEKGLWVVDTRGGIWEIPQALPLHILNPQNHVLMQYTGLKNRNGKEIYEGDIAQGYLGRKYLVECHHGSYWVNGGPTNGNYLLGNEHGVLTIVGNIHENPELLEVKENAK